MQLSSYLLLALDVALPLLLFTGLAVLFLIHKKNFRDTFGFSPGFVMAPEIFLHPQSKKHENGLRVVYREEEEANDDQEDVKKTILFTTEEADVIQNNVDTLMKSRPYLKHRYSIRDMALQLGIPSYQLSAFINQKNGVNFNDFINKERIMYCLDLINKGEIEGLNLFGLSDKCGFSNRNTFRNAFKKFTGKTPSIFIKDND